MVQKLDCVGVTERNGASHRPYKSTQSVGPVASAIPLTAPISDYLCKARRLSRTFWVFGVFGSRCEEVVGVVIVARETLVNTWGRQRLQWWQYISGCSD